MIAYMKVGLRREYWVEMGTAIC